MQDHIEESPTEYHIDVSGADDRGRAIKQMIVSRMGYATRQSMTPDIIEETETEALIESVAYQATEDRDYLLHDTPLKESIFRVLLANENKPMTAAEVSKILVDKWAMSSLPRDTSPAVIERILEHGAGSYCINPVPPPPSDDNDAEEAE